MNQTPKSEEVTVVVHSTRFGDLTVPAETIINFPSGLVGFPSSQKFIMIDHKPPFSWLQSVDNPNLAFVVVDGFEFGEQYKLKPPVGDKDCDFNEEDEYAILVIVTVRPDASQTTANLKAPLFVNVRNRRGVQVIYDDQRFQTRHPLFGKNEEQAEEEGKK